MLQFLIQFIKHPRKIGAIAPSGVSLAQKMMEPIDFTKARCITEYGPGTGSFTDELIREKRPETCLLLIEQNPTFCKLLRDKYQSQPNVHIIEGTAADINLYLSLHGFSNADYIVSGLPFTSLPEKISSSILSATKQAIGEEGAFITFQYSLVKKHFFETHFTIVHMLRELHNLPPAYVLVMKSCDPR
ncbi:MAG: SAM-dependent methyltransferase [Firmicutes bacterium]|nr:SAM-dependent methyltransferase [Bacillota bacterium]